MKTFFTLLFLLPFLSFSQAPQAMSYQAVVRDASNTILANQQIGLEVSIYQNSVTGTAVYTETQTPTTSAVGLITIEIGNGTATTGTFSTIDWSTGNYWLETKIDPAGGTNYTITGSSQLLSVPFAFHSNTSSAVTSSSSGSSNAGKTWLIPYMTYGATASQIIYVTSYFSDPAATSGSTDLTLEAIDDQGNSFSLGTITTVTDERVTRLQSLINQMLQAGGFVASKASLKITSSNADFDFYFYAAFTVGTYRSEVQVIELD